MFVLNALRCSRTQFLPFTSKVLSYHQLHGWQQRCPNTKLSLVRLVSSARDTGSTPQQAEQIYYGTLTPKIRAVKIFSLTTSLVGLATQPILIEQSAKLGGTALVVFACGFVGFFTFVTPLFLHLITKKYVCKIHYDAVSKEYTATTISFLLLKKRTTFTVADITVPDVAGMFTTFKVRQIPLFVDVAQFTDPSHYVKMMGFDRPIDFKFDLAKEAEQPPISNKK